MFTLAINETGDIFFENGNIVMVEGNDVYVQQIKVLLGTRLGEYFLNPSNEGINHEIFFDKKIVSLDEVKSEITRIVKQIVGFIGMQSLDVEIDNERRKLYIKFKAVFNKGLIINFEDEVKI